MTTKYETVRKRVRRSQSRCEDAISQNEFNNQKDMQQISAFLAQSGGLSRLTIFNNAWHEQNPTAAKLLRGYESWEETKLYVGAYFPGEVDTQYDPSKIISREANGQFQEQPKTWHHLKNAY